MALDIDYKPVVEKWPMTKDPLAAIKEFRKWHLWLRWLRPAHRKASKYYYNQRAEWIGKTDFEDYFENADRSINKEKWEYLRLRKSWYQMPLNWEKFCGEDCTTILDLGCGDGDLTQTLVDFICNEFKRTGKGHKIHIVGSDLSPSRIGNAQKHVTSTDDRVTMEFQVDDATKPLPFDDKHFDYSLNSGVFEILADESADKFAGELCRLTKYGIYTEDLADEYPGGFPRQDLNCLFNPHGFKVTRKAEVLTEPWSTKINPKPCGIWPMLLDQNVWCEPQ
jgi:SAM-dependent methyltransferase